jgi:tetratricopeptide (TPR) repeat protein
MTQDTNRLAFPSPRQVSLKYDWTSLIQAHHLVRQAQVDDALPIYRRVLPNLYQYIHDEREGYGWGVLSDNPDVPSLNWTAIYLFDYCNVVRMWSAWLYIAQKVFDHPAYESLSDICKSRLISAKGMSSIGHVPYQEIIVEQQAALDRFALTSLEKALHFMVMGYAYQVMLKPEETLSYLGQAVELFTDLGEPFYVIRCKGLIGSAYHRFCDYDLAIQSYDDVEAIVATVGESAEFEAMPYSLGWAYVKSGQVEKALASFQRGQRITAQRKLYYDLGQNLYGEGYVRLVLNQYDEALNALHRGLAIFRGTDEAIFQGVLDQNVISRDKTAACLYIVSMTYDRLGQWQEALTKAEEALTWQRPINSPIQLYDMVLNAAHLYRKNRRWLKALALYYESFKLGWQVLRVQKRQNDKG